MKKPRHSFRDRPARKAARLRRFVKSLDQAGTDQLVEFIAREMERQVAVHRKTAA